MVGGEVPGQAGYEGTRERKNRRREEKKEQERKKQREEVVLEQTAFGRERYREKGEMLFGGRPGGF